MTALLMPALDVIDAGAVDGRCRRYAEEFGFDVAFDRALSAICLTMTVTSAVMVPSTLGRKVVSRLNAVPVFSVDRRGHRLWVLLADAPASPVEADRMTLRLFAVGAMPVLARARIALPTPGDPRRVWLSPPAGRARPGWAELAEAITDAATRAGSPHA